MNDEQIKEVMRLADELADACAGCDSSHFALGQRAALEAHLRTLGEPESVNAELLDRISDAMQSYERHGAVCMFEGSPMIYASTLTEIADIAAIVETPTEALERVQPPEAGD